MEHKMQKYVVETLVTFREIHVVEAENEEKAKIIAENSDYNMSKHLGNQVMTVYNYSDADVDRFYREDEYFWNGVKSVDDRGFLVYTNEHGPRVTNEKIF